MKIKIDAWTVERTIEYVAPFDRCDREKDYETAWADRIGRQMAFAENRSPSFKFFYEAICQRLGQAA